MTHGNLAVFALDASRDFGTAVARTMGIALEPHEEREFEDGEHKSRPLTSVRDRDVYVLQSLHAGAGQGVNDRLVRLLLFLGALKDASAARITAVVPYLAYARKDSKSKSRDPVSTRYVAQLFEAIGTDCVVTMDVHNLAAFQNAFRCRSENLVANPLFVAYFASRIGDAAVVVVAPDAGGIKRAEDFRRRLAEALGRPVPMAFAEKHRSSGVVSGEAMVGDVSGRVAIIVDDLISGGTTVARTAQACRTRGARQVHVAATHGLFSPGAGATLAQAAIDDVVVTDTVSATRVSDTDLARRITRISAAPLFGEAILRLHRGGSLVELGGG